MSKFKLYNNELNQWIAFSETNQPAFSSIQADGMLLEADSPNDLLLFETDPYISIEPNDDGSGFKFVIDKNLLLQDYYNKTQVETLLDNIEKYRLPLSTYKSNKDTFGIFTTIEWKRQDGTLYKKSVLSGTAPYYDTKVITYYDNSGTVIQITQTYQLTYDNDGDLISEVLIT
jgi:hypothetical protein